MKEKQTDWKAIRNGIITALIPSIILLIINSSLYLFQKEKVNISITSSIYIDNKYITTINIKNYQKNKSISEINLWTKDIDVDKVHTDISNNYDEANNHIKLKELSPGYNGAVIIYSDKEINEENLSLELNEKVNVVFLKSQKESSYIKITEYLVIVLIYFIEFASIAIINQKNINKEKERTNKECDKIRETLEKQEERTKKLFKYEENNRFRLQRRLWDYSKELNFWKDTIRKMLYKSRDRELNNEEIFKIVTQNLKTYRTLDKIHYRDVEDIVEDLKENKE